MVSFVVWKYLRRDNREATDEFLLIFTRNAIGTVKTCRKYKQNVSIKVIFMSQKDNPPLGIFRNNGLDEIVFKLYAPLTIEMIELNLCLQLNTLIG